jgi:hypothetical protein
MKHSVSRSSHPRALTEKERVFTRWLLERARASDVDKRQYLLDLESATVARMCGCGCASIDFALPGVETEPAAPIRPLGDFTSKDKRFGVFAFAKQGRLAGVEVYPLADFDLAGELPEADWLIPMSEDSAAR